MKCVDLNGCGMWKESMLLYKDSKEVTGKTIKRREKEGRPRLRCMNDVELDFSNVGVKNGGKRTELATVMRGRGRT